ncbi:MAG: polyprenyl synthetase family protein [Flavobacteriales bacterium]|nr:polyprenyl synthetase family protein [Flavobacteriales bacterium]
MQPYKDLIEARIEAWCKRLPTQQLYAPMAYLLKLPAKRVRPIAALMACELFGGKAEDALDEALGIELFHNFTLMHDDIMDASPLRRGDPTVHVKWNVNTAILSGDALLVKSFELMGRDAAVRALFNRYALEVCEGQQHDMDFERRTDVTATEYMEMIRLKTAVLLSCALQVGALIAGASDGDRQRIGRFGEQLGLAFQLRDDLLDAFGDPMETGKQRGGDLRAGKKTWLLIRGLEHERADGTSVLSDQIALAPAQRDVHRMGEAMERLGARSDAEAEVSALECSAFEALDSIGVNDERKAALHALATTLMGRRS